jgi:hypothetical protein
LTKVNDSFNVGPVQTWLRAQLQTAPPALGCVSFWVESLLVDVSRMAIRRDRQVSGNEFR